jgi:hypothetical protein
MKAKKDTPQKEDSLIKNGLLMVLAGIIGYPIIGIYISIAIAAIGVLMLILEMIIKFSDRSNSNF